MADERARENWGEDKEARAGEGEFSRTLSSANDLPEEKRVLLAVLFTNTGVVRIMSAIHAETYTSALMNIGTQ